MLLKVGRLRQKCWPPLLHSLSLSAMLRNPELTGGGVKPNPTRHRASERGRERTSEAANERLPSFLISFSCFMSHGRINFSVATSVALSLLARKFKPDPSHPPSRRKAERRRNMLITRWQKTTDLSVAGETFTDFKPDMIFSKDILPYQWP